MVVGFTGTRQGMTLRQETVVRDLLNELHPHIVVHGDCLGADADFHELAKAAGLEIHIRPGHNRLGESPTRAFCEGATQVFPARFYLDRDQDIVDDAVVGDGILIACPKGMNEERRSGTWATIRKARAAHVPQYIVGPNGALI